MQRDESIRILGCEGVYSPAEDTFLMLQAVQVRRDEKVLEMGTGTGMVAVHLAKAGAMVTAADIDPDAVRCAKDNASINDVLLNTVESDLYSNVDGTYDLIIFNPPYLRGEPDTTADRAWAGGPNGTELLHRFLTESEEHLAAGGRMMIITSSDMDKGSLDKVLRPYEVREISSMRLFFEELKVLELRLDPSRGRVRSLF